MSIQTTTPSLPFVFPHAPLKAMDPAMLVFELNRETLRLLPEHSELITSAATMAAFLHDGQTRFTRGKMSRVPYIEHPIRCALRAIRWGLVEDPYLVAGALLHDVREDCEARLLATFGLTEETGAACLERLYGAEISEMVDDLTSPAWNVDRAAYLRWIDEIIAKERRSTIGKALDLKDNAGSIKHQLGTGIDQKLLAMLDKYYLPVVRIADPLDELGAGRAADDMRVLRRDLEQVAHDHSVVLSEG